jgi:hypothetical protein
MMSSRRDNTRLVAAVIGSAVIPTVIANAFYLPRHLLPRDQPDHRRNGAGAALRRISRGAE